MSSITSWYLACFSLLVVYWQQSPMIVTVTRAGRNTPLYKVGHQIEAKKICERNEILEQCKNLRSEHFAGCKEEAPRVGMQPPKCQKKGVDRYSVTSVLKHKPEPRWRYDTPAVVLCSLHTGYIQAGTESLTSPQPSRLPAPFQSFHR